MRKAWKIIFICFLIWSLLLCILSFIWYKGIFKGYFSFFDDSLEWLQMDKLGHFFCSFHVGRWFIQILQWQKVDKEEAINIGSWGGMIFVSPIEILDGFSEAYGFSWSDIGANFLGSLFLMSQLKWAKYLILLPKFSFLPSPFSAIRKEMLGDHILSKILKDYNGQTYWLSYSPNIFFKKKIFPAWLLLSVGYGVENVLGGHDNEWYTKEGVKVDYSHLARTREFYFSLDVTLQHISFDNKAMKFIRLALSCLKFPFPALVLSQERGFRLSWLAF